MPQYDYKYLLASALAITTEVVMTNEIDFGFATPAPNIGGKFGLHVVITTTFTGAASGVYFWILHGAATGLTTSSLKHTGMFVLTGATLINGLHYFIPCGPYPPLLEFVGAKVTPVSEALATGALTAWFGTDVD